MRAASSVLVNDSCGSFWIIGSIAHRSPNGTSRVREIARHSTYTPSSLSSNLQWEYKRHRNPCPVSGGSTFSLWFPGSATSSTENLHSDWNSERGHIRMTRRNINDVPST